FRTVCAPPARPWRGSGDSLQGDGPCGFYRSGFRRGLERNLVVEIEILLRAGAGAAALTAALAAALTAEAATGFIVPAAAAEIAAALAVEHLQLAPEALEHDLGGVFFLAGI